MLIITKDGMKTITPSDIIAVIPNLDKTDKE